jgi:hypothetical protein
MSECAAAPADDTQRHAAEVNRLLDSRPVKTPVRCPSGGQMDEFTESQLRDALAELGNARFEQADVLKSPKLLERRREAGRVVAKLFVDAGLDVRQLERVQSQYRSELHRVAEERRLDAVSKSGGRETLCIRRSTPSDDS